MKIIFSFCEVKFPIYLNRRVFVMNRISQIRFSAPYFSNIAVFKTSEIMLYHSQTSKFGLKLKVSHYENARIQIY